MHRLLLAFRAFFLVLFYAETAGRVKEALDRRASEPQGESAQIPKMAPAKKPAKPRIRRSEAVTLLASLQREARFVDFIQESLAGYSDAQIGAAVRDVHRGCEAVLHRVFALRPVVAGDEDADIEVERGFDAGRFQLVGNVAGEPPFRGRLVHHGWEATQCDLATWTGSDAAANVVAPAQVEVK